MRVVLAALFLSIAAALARASGGRLDEITCRYCLGRRATARRGLRARAAVREPAGQAEHRQGQDDLFVRTRVHEMLMQKKSKDEISAVLKSDFQGAQLVFPGLLDGLLTELQ
jgi:hypothetical protein